MAFGTVPNAGKYGGVQYLCPKAQSHDFCGAILDYLVWLSNETAPAWVHSFSYGGGYGRCAAKFRTAMDTAFQKLGARGISLLFASGDEGAPIWPGGQMYPACSAFVTAVGAGVGLSAAVGSFVGIVGAPVGSGVSRGTNGPVYRAIPLDMRTSSCQKSERALRKNKTSSSSSKNTSSAESRLAM